MNKLLENMFKNRCKQSLQEFDMSKSSNSMMRYLGSGFPYDDGNNLPIEPQKSGWEHVQIGDKICLKRTYDLKQSKLLLYFVNEVIHLSEEMYHHPDILISHTEVTINLFTRDLNDVTDRDIEMSKKIDDIIEDINIINFRS